MSALPAVLTLLASWFGQDVPTRTANAYQLSPGQTVLDNNRYHLSTVLNQTEMSQRLLRLRSDLLGASAPTTYTLDLLRIDTRKLPAE